MATIYRVDGTLETVTPATGGEFTLNEVWAIVGGYVQLIPCESCNQLGFFLADEDGGLKHLPLNPHASGLAAQPIVGTALHTNSEEFP